MKNNNELEWKVSWLREFDPSLHPTMSSELYAKLKEAQNPEEFIHILAQDLRQCHENCPIEHAQNLKHLSRTLLGLLSDVFSISVKSHLHALFALGSLNAKEPTKRLATYWEGFRAKELHKQVLRKLANITTHALKIKDNDGKISKQALELASIVSMHNENLIDVRVLERIEGVLGIREGAANSSVAAFEVVSLHILSPGHEAQLDSVRARSIEILKQICAKALQDASLVGQWKSGFAFVLHSMGEEEILNLTAPIATQLQAQKFSYQGVLFAFDFKVEVIGQEELSRRLKDS